METVLVTGAAGYLGTSLVPHLLWEGFRVRAFDRFRHRGPGLLGCCHHPHLEIVRGDVRDPSAMSEALKGVDWIIPLAAVVGAPACEQDVLDATSINLNSILMLVRLRGKGQKILYPATNSGYGTTKPGEVCTEAATLKPISHYGRTKGEAEAFVLERGESLSFRFATAFGASPRMRLDLLVNDFVLRAVRDKSVVLYEPHFRRNYIHVRDMARAFVHGLKNWDLMQGRAYNCGLPHSCSKRQLCEIIQGVLPAFQFLEADAGSDPDKRDYDVSTKRLLDAGFFPDVDLGGGIVELVKAYQTFPGPEFTNL